MSWKNSFSPTLLAPVILFVPVCTGIPGISCSKGVYVSKSLRHTFRLRIFFLHRVQKRVQRKHQHAIRLC
jgi:hypothetical protein